MPDTPAPQVVIAQPPEPTWNTKEVVADLKADLLHRFDRADDTLSAIHNELKTMATKEDIRAVREETSSGLSEVHKRIDKVVETFDNRVAPLEADDAAEKAVAQSRTRFRTNLAWTVGIAGSAALIAGTIFGILSAVH